ncbi:MAG: Eco57I restriction-modification methylase domain-containing protein [Treponema sp.]|nr:Eco57I restriction-modification methylase domain-containing protein [Treponema sp.]
MLAIKDIATARKRRISTVTTVHKEKFAQYLTPIEIARFMTKLSIKYWKKANFASIIDPGAGTGILSYCLINELLKKNSDLTLSIDAWEMDKSIIPELSKTFQNLEKSNLNYTIQQNDFITSITHDIYFNASKQYDFVIMNPPYKKINSDSVYRNALRNIGIETVNTYSAFMALAIKLMADNGILTAIVPRSFCNGLYFLPFRKFLLDNTSILHIHLFESRDNAFRDENVLQENVIIVLKKTKRKQTHITISHSTDKLFSNYTENHVPYSDIIIPDDEHKYIFIPTKPIPASKNILSCSNGDLYFDISTGPVVDFRLKEKLIFDEPNDNNRDAAIPLLYPVHIRNQEVNWPIQSKKPNAIMLNEMEQKKIAFPKGYYVLVKRFSSKEEKRRLYATLLTPDSLPADYFTVENHLNIIHYKRKSLTKDIATGLTAYLNTAYCDNLFRNFSGHTQVNATDLRNMKYPTSDTLAEFARLVKRKRIEEYDQIFEKLVLNYAK